MSWCLFGFPQNADVEGSPCVTRYDFHIRRRFSHLTSDSTACGGMEPAIEFGQLSQDVDEYGYCPTFTNASDPTGPAIAKCNGCLLAQNNVGQNYLNNCMLITALPQMNDDADLTVFTALDAGCIQQPAANSTISIVGNIFSTQQVNITTPKPAEGAFVPSKGLSLGAKIGIAIGAIVLALIVAGFCIIWNGKRRRRAALRERQRESGVDEDWSKYNNFNEQHVGGVPSMMHATPPMGAMRGGQEFFDSPDSQFPLTHQQPPWASGGRQENESPASAFGEKVYFSPYSSTYNSPISAHDHIPPIARDWPAVERKGSIQDSTPVGRDWGVDRKGSVQSGPGRVRSRSREKKEMGHENGAIEMQDVPVILQQPTHGRPTSGGLTEADAKRGSAV